jgi:hypothetical protein
MNVHRQKGLLLGARVNGGHASVQGRVGLLLGATFKRGEDTFMSMGGVLCCLDIVVL